MTSNNNESFLQLNIFGGQSIFVFSAVTILLFMMEELMDIPPTQCICIPSVILNKESIKEYKGSAKSGLQNSNITMKIKILNI